MFYDFQSSDPSNNAPPKRSYASTKVKQLDNWKKLRSVLVDAFLESLAPSSCCSVCRVEFSGSKVFHCEDCLPPKYFCKSCLDVTHRQQPFHRVYTWKEKAWVPYSATIYLRDDERHKECLESYNKHVIVVDSKGRHHTVVVKFCKCEEEPTTLIRLCLWPASPKNPKICFDFHLMEMLRVLYLQVPVPVFDFCESLKYIHHPYVEVNDPFLQDIYKVLINETFEEYRFFIHQLEVMSAPEDIKCPACPVKDEYQRIISMDANFGLVRKKTSGRSVEEPKHSGVYFVDQNEVDQFLKENSKTQPPKTQEFLERKP
ncbi:uncharacterized protein LOC135493966 isoform X2 [Lineus longissimus]|uniref:uncharacterized protein LOC135493966 isoform X2 n=1 Tax=Lineus longissimus TaxID=88925 RepID=UPI00315DF368